jgi:hypothetical protein
MLSGFNELEYMNHSSVLEFASHVRAVIAHKAEETTAAEAV